MMIKYQASLRCMAKLTVVAILSMVALVVWVKRSDKRNFSIQSINEVGSVCCCRAKSFAKISGRDQVRSLL